MSESKALAVGAMSSTPDPSKELDDALREARATVARAATTRTEQGRVLAVLEELDRAIAASANDHARNYFLSVVCHDLKDPLAAVLMGAAFLLKTMPVDPANPRARRMVEAIARSGERMNGLMRNLVDFMRLEGGRIEVDAAPCEVAALLDAAAAKLRPAAEAKEVAIVTAVSPGLKALCDAERFGQIVYQLGVNAIRYAPRNSDVTVRGDSEGGAARITIRDRGPGIGGERLANIFDPYWHARQSPRDGTGLGLAIAKGLVEAQGGRLEVQTAPGAGSTFGFTLPAA